MPKQVVQPSIRFSEFEGKDWIEYPLSKVAKIERGRFSPRPRNDPQFYGGDIPFAQTNDVSSSRGYISTYSQTLNEKGLKVSKLFPEGTILMTIAANIGYCGLLKRAMACPDSLVGISCKKGTHNRFLSIYLNREQPRIDYLAPQAAQKNINIEFLSPYKVKLPSDEGEQQKIADFLTSVDTKINQLTEKHRLLKEYKKGVMQQVFSQQIRFKDEDGNAFSDWEIKALNEISLPVKRKASSVIENVMTISAGKGFLHQKDRFSQVIAGTSLDKYTHLMKGEFSYNRGNSKSFKYGCVYLLLDDEALVPFVYRSFKLAHGVSDFYAQLFEHKYLDRQLRRLISSSARMDGLLNIGEKDFYQVTLPVPSEPEQQKIAQFLQSIDRKIEGVAKQIEQTKQFKKGLLQQMFV
ncbi:restriction endonuclease subunit S [Photobacterium chitinilyticum]|uniref:Restriction endonuclease subunit S n=1 Tax=Photobacterium chitinilyticum TaxID=2485123 RepID=A0A444JMM5_9GAMM|nr:restriction endonuclease subunit S [Photobacterium chitinilyticum]RWX54343.1 restriction endonuclease subunit S [Photobacterium chitinilyticum]